MKYITTLFFIIIFIALGYLAYNNYTLKQKIEFYAEAYNEFHENLYASHGSLNDQNTHLLSISDDYYKANFTQPDE